LAEEPRANGQEGKPDPEAAGPPSSNRPESYVERFAIDATRWLLEHAPRSRNGRITAFLVAFVFVTLPSALLVAWTLFGDQQQIEGWFETLGYAGVFIANLLSTGTVFIPVPGLLAVGHALIITGSQVLSPFLVGVVGGIGMGLGETTAYLTGLIGSETARQTQPRLPRWIEPAVSRLVRWVQLLMSRYGLPTLFVLSVIPDPIFEFAGITAGATRIGFRPFIAVVVSGNVVRGLLLAYFGDELFPFI
jgi:membrane protein DedA with SNARE-associated domain